MTQNNRQAGSRSSPANTSLHTQGWYFISKNQPEQILLRDRIWASKRMYIYMYIWASVCIYNIYSYICMSIIIAFGYPGRIICVQDGVPTSYMEAAFVLLVHEGSETWTSRLIFLYQAGLFWRQMVHRSRDTNVSFKPQRPVSLLSWSSYTHTWIYVTMWGSGYLTPPSMCLYIMVLYIGVKHNKECCCLPPLSSYSKKCSVMTNYT